jgi:hypothetical protein
MPCCEGDGEGKSIQYPFVEYDNNGTEHDPKSGCKLILSECPTGLATLTKYIPDVSDYSSLVKHAFLIQRFPK